MPADWSADDAASIDGTTLFYDAFQGTDAQGAPCAYLVGPAFRGAFRAFLRAARFRIAGQEAAATEVSTSKRCSILRLTPAADAAGPVLDILHPRLAASLALQPPALDDFAGTRALVTVGRNNRLDWVRDWVELHRDLHGVDAVLYFDNGSDLYSAADLAGALAGIGGLACARVVSLPFPFGPPGDAPERRALRYLQFAMLEIARLRFLERARAVLQVDVDEVVYAPEGRSVFDACEETPEGYLCLGGTWRHARADAQGTVRHRDHLFVSTDPESRMNPKWALLPGGPLKGTGWRLHGVRQAERAWARGFGYLHCRALTNRPPDERPLPPDAALTPDPLAARVFGATLPRA